MPIKGTLNAQGSQKTASQPEKSVAPSVKLNIFQRGALQDIFTGLVGFLCIVASTYILFLLDRERFLNNASISIIDLIVIAAIFSVIGFVAIKFSSRFNLAWSVTLPKAVEFSSALRKLRILDLKKQIAFVREHRLSVFIAAAPILGDERGNVQARFYPFVHNILASESVFTNNIGKRTLCLDAEEYERVVKEVDQEDAERESVAIAAKNEEIKGLRAAVASLTQENMDLVAENKKLHGKVDIQPAHEGGRIDRLREERLLWAAYIPVMERLLREAPEGKQYTTPEIEDAFKAEWERRTDLREHMLRLTESEEANPSESFLKAVKAEFKEVGKLSPGGRPKKNP